jgi:hypothetical protein
MTTVLNTDSYLKPLLRADESVQSKAISLYERDLQSLHLQGLQNLMSRLVLTSDVEANIFVQMQL